VTLLGKPESLITRVTDRPGHDRRYSVDSSKVRALGWEPRMPFEQGLAATVAWYVDNQPWWRPIKSGEFAEYYARNYAGRSA
jgi:dTDP-glucose 4,6-dehydratase